MSIEYNESVFQAIKNMPCYYAIKDLNHEYAYMSDVMAKVVGYAKAEEGIGNGDTDFKCDAVEGAPEYKKQDQLAWKNGEARSIHIYAFNGGDKRILLDHKKAMYDEAGNCVGNNLYAIDIKETLGSFEKLVDLFEIDQGFLNIKQKKNFSYHMLEAYPDLTKRESQCLFYLLRGKSVKVVAKMMGVSPRTVEHYVNILKDKFNCHTRDQIVQYAEQHNYLGVILNNMLLDTSMSLHF